MPLLQQVLDSAGMCADAANVGLNLDMLYQQIKARQADVTGQASVEIAAFTEGS
jgi:hypothetical protein